MIIASQLPLSSWYMTIEERTVVDGVFDRVIHNSIKVELLGESMRKFVGSSYQSAPSVRGNQTEVSQ